ncbi:MAG: SOS response-associated peptidase [Gammaproteobacteria bacterium]|nr:SOS response-associated peptidase [Gammaproteobacteria bacterium]
MCGRFNVTADPLTVLLMELVGMTHPGPDNFNTAPTETVTVLRLDAGGEPELVPMRWWLTPYWAKEMSSKYSMFNAKSETAHKSPAFREPFQKRHCVVPVCGFYEWTRLNNQKLPYFITPTEFPGMLLAGLWDRWHNKETGEVVESFTILTTDAHDELQFVHKRQPAMLSLGDAHRWLDTGVAGEDLMTLFESAIPMTLEAIPVSTYVNNARNKDARCIDPIGASIMVGERGAEVP